MTTPTSNPVPSADPNDLLFNAEKLDQVVSSSDEAYTDRLGISRKTIAGAIATIVAFNSRGAWAPATAYAVRDLVIESGTWYACVVAHTSSAAFPTDEASKWRVHQGITTVDLGAGAGSGLVGFDDVETYADGTLGAALQETKRQARRGPRFHAWGGQLSKLGAALSNPLEQLTGIVFVGDSITWGSGVPDVVVSTPRDGTLSDPRMIFAANSYVNVFKRHIGSAYAFGASPVLSNWPAAPSGEAIVEYSRDITVYPFTAEFTLTSTGTGLTDNEVIAPDTLTRYQRRLGDANTAGTSNHTISFAFTGTEFTLSFGAVETGIDYELIVDGVSQGTFVTRAGEAGLTVGSDRRRTHTFPYVRNKTVQIKTKYRLPPEPGTTASFFVEAIIIPKKIRVTNQGIIGSSTNSFRINNLTGNTSGDGDAVGPQDNFVFVQLGTNDRGFTNTRPAGVNSLRHTAKQLIDLITPLADVIVMCANPALDEDPAVYGFNMQDTRNTLYRVARDNSIDFIDNYSIFDGMASTYYTADGLHPNTTGHSIIADNIIGAMESA